jgi:hypothetical protein
VIVSSNKFLRIKYILPACDICNIGENIRVLKIPVISFFDKGKLFERGLSFFDFIDICSKEKLALA